MENIMFSLIIFIGFFAIVFGFINEKNKSC
jgi:hypothetical protein